MNLETLELPLSDTSKQILQAAEEEARAFGHKWLGTEQILLAMIESESRIALLLKRFGLTPQETRRQVHRIINALETLPGSFEVNMTPRTSNAIDHAVRIAGSSKSAEIQPNHLLLGIIAEGQGVGLRVLENCGVDLRKLREALESFSDSEQQES